MNRSGEKFRVKRSVLYLTLLVAFSVTLLAGCGGSVADSGDPTGGSTDENTSGSAGDTQMGETMEIGSAIEETTSAPARDVFFPQSRPSDGLPASAGLSRELVLDEEGCIRIGGGGPPYYLPLWPDYFELSAEGDEIRILDGEGDFVARVGGRIDTGGGEIQQGETTPRKTFQALRRLVGEDTARELRERCPGPYWIVGPSEDHIQYP